MKILRPVLLMAMSIFIANGLFISSTAVADRPERIDFGPLNFEGFFVSSCVGGFDVLWDFAYYGEYFIHLNKDGDPERIFYKQHYPGSYYNSLYPDIRVYLNKPTGDQRWIYVEDGEEVIADIRLHTILTVPGYGIIEQDVGHVELDLRTFEVTFNARDYSFDLDALCEALSP